jgi:hypothetical protein
MAQRPKQRLDHVRDAIRLTHDEAGEVMAGRVVAFWRSFTRSTVSLA